MLNTYHISVELEASIKGPDWFNAVVVAQHNHDDEAAEEVKDFFERHGIRCKVAHAWEVA